MYEEPISYTLIVIKGKREKHWNDLWIVVENPTRKKGNFQETTEQEESRKRKT